MTLEDLKSTALALETISPNLDVPGREGPGADVESEAVGEDRIQDPPPPDEGGTDGLLAPKGAAFPLNDTGNGQRFDLYYGRDVMHVPRVGWHVWDEKRWKLDPDLNVVRGRAQKVQDRIVEEIPHVVLEDWQVREIEREPTIRLRKAELSKVEAKDRTPEQDIEFEDVCQKLTYIRKLKDQRSGLKTAHRTFAKTSGNSGRIDAMLREAAVHLANDVSDLDADPLTICVENGVLRFRVTDGSEDGGSKTADFTLEPHMREASVAGRNAPQFITKMMPVTYRPDARCPTFDAFLNRIQPDREIQGFLQRWYGLSLTGQFFQGFAFFFGDGANGKSVLNGLMARLAGDYAAKCKIESITGHNRRGGGDATPDLMNLIGARLAHAAEPEEGQKLQEAIIKELTGGDPMLVRHLHSDFVEVKPHFKLTISGNHKPLIQGTDGGIWRRVKLVPFDVQIPKDEQDPHLLDKLWEERDGILLWLIDGLMDFLEGGLQEPDKVLAATDEYRADSDPIGTFLRECCVVDGSDEFVESRTLINAFNYWLDLRGEPMWARKASLKFKSLCGKYRDPNTGRVYAPAKRAVTGYKGIRFTAEFQELISNASLDAKGRWIANTGAFGGDTT